MSLQDKSSIVLPKGFAGKAGTLECWNPNTDSLVGLSVVRATTATRVNESGLIESVSANVPRRDFLNGGCGELLIEPQRTNVEANSNTFSGTGASVTTGQQSPTAAGNEGVLFEGDGTNIQPRSVKTITFLSSGEAVISVRAKAGTNDFIALGFQTFTAGSGTAFSYFDLANGTTPTSGARIESLGNGWYQCFSAPYTIDAGDLTGICTVFITPSTSSLNFASTAAANGQNVLLYQFQAETGSYGTSVIPTSGAAVTRNADVISDTGLAALLGQSGGGLYFEAQPFILSGVQSFTLSNGTNDNRCQTYFTATQIGLDVVQGGVIQASISGGTPSASAFNKVCTRYAKDDFTIHLGGARVAQDTSGSTFSGTTLSNFTTASATGASSQFYGRVRELIIFKETPTESQANALTA